MPTRYAYIVRHAQSANNASQTDDKREGVAEKAGRQCDPGLTDIGHQQAQAVAYQLKRISKDPNVDDKLRPSILYASGFRRSLQTGKHIVDALGVRSALEILLHEEGGVFDGPRHGRPRAATEGQKLQHGLTADEINKELPGIAGLDAVPSTGWWKGGRESSVESLERAVLSAKWLWGLVEQDNEEGAIVCVSHGLFMDKWLKAIMGMDADDNKVFFMTYNCAYWFLALNFDPDASNSSGGRQAIVMAPNYTDHIPMAIRTGHKHGCWNHCHPSYPPEEDKCKPRHGRSSTSIPL